MSEKERLRRNRLEAFSSGAEGSGGAEAASEPDAPSLKLLRLPRGDGAWPGTSNDCALLQIRVVAALQPVGAERTQADLSGQPVWLVWRTEEERPSLTNPPTHVSCRAFYIRLACRPSQKTAEWRTGQPRRCAAFIATWKPLSTTRTSSDRKQVRKRAVRQFRSMPHQTLVSRRHRFGQP